ncbi:MAG: GNAT family N-acetyltransferase [Bryobacteraceae bacterium]|jgi:ribosomal protein S18 acetylase RimI-like enzyme
MIEYRLGSKLDAHKVISLYEASALAEHRPIRNPERMASMLERANLVVTAWDGEMLIGILRALSDFAFVTYVSDVAVHTEYQRRGIGKELIRIAQREGGPNAHIVLLATPKNAEYYQHIGFTLHSSAWILRSYDTVR